MSTLTFDINDITHKQNFINLKLSGFSLKDIADSVGISYSTAKRVCSKLKPDIEARILENDNTLNLKLVNRIDVFLDSLEKHFDILLENIQDKFICLSYNELVSATSKITNSFEKLVKLRLLLNSSINQYNRNSDSVTEPSDPLNGSDHERVTKSSLVADEPYDPQNGSENVTQDVRSSNPDSSGLVDEPSDPQNGSDHERVPQTLSREPGKSLVADEPSDPQNGSETFEDVSMTLDKYRRMKLAKCKKPNQVF